MVCDTKTVSKEPAMKAIEKPVPFRCQIRIPPQMADWIKQQAAENFRSFNGELVEIIRSAMKAQTNNAK